MSHNAPITTVDTASDDIAGTTTKLTPELTELTEITELTELTRQENDPTRENKNTSTFGTTPTATPTAALENIINNCKRAIKSISELQCSICHHVLLDPAILPCSHGFCSSCISVELLEQLRQYNIIRNKNNKYNKKKNNINIIISDDKNINNLTSHRKIEIENFISCCPLCNIKFYNNVNHISTNSVAPPSSSSPLSNLYYSHLTVHPVRSLHLDNIIMSLIDKIKNIKTSILKYNNNGKNNFKKKKSIILKILINDINNANIINNIQGDHLKSALKSVDGILNDWKNRTHALNSAAVRKNVSIVVHDISKNILNDVGYGTNINQNIINQDFFLRLDCAWIAPGLRLD